MVIIKLKKKIKTGYQILSENLTKSDHPFYLDYNLASNTSTEIATAPATDLGTPNDK